MTPEDRLDRIERIAKLFVKAGRRARRNMWEQDEKINILINLHIQNEEMFAKNETRFAKNETRFAKHDENIKVLIEFQKQNEERFRQNEKRFRQNEERFRRNEERFARTDERFADLAVSQADSDRRLNSLIEIIRDERNGAS